MKFIHHTDNAKGLIETRFRHIVYKMLLVIGSFRTRVKTAVCCSIGESILTFYFSTLVTIVLQIWHDLNKIADSSFLVQYLDVDDKYYP